MDFRYPASFRRIGNYRLGEVIGGMCSDGYNEVRLGIHVPTSTRVAVKIIDIRDEKVRERAYHELAVLKQLGTHKHVVTLYDTEEDQDSLYLFMEYCPGGDLYNYIEKQGPLTEPMARSFLRQIVSALEFCHGKGYAHHDVKLENILLTRDNEVLVSDFGFSQQIPSHVDGEERKAITAFSGSPLYMAPEVFALQPHDELVDMWSLGVCVYHMVVGTFPFLANSLPGLEEAITFHDVRFTPSMNLSSSVQDLIRQMLTKDPNKRIRFSQLKIHKWMSEDTRPPFGPRVF